MGFADSALVAIGKAVKKAVPNNTSAGGPAPMVAKPYQPQTTGVFLTQASRQPRPITNVKTEPRNIMEWKDIK